jgi:two-component system LytT family response regulator
MRAVIIDDEKDAVNFIESIILEYCNSLNIVGKAHSVTEGTNLIQKELPEIVFLDVEMPDGTGFNLLQNFPKRDFKVIFITAFNHYALQAIKFSAVDYILKPINIQDFIKAVNNVIMEVESQKALDLKISCLLDNLKSTTPSKISVSTTDGIEYIETSEIVHIQADRSYSHIFLSDGRKLMVSKNLGEFQELLIDRDFYRTHNSHLVNMHYVKKYVRSDGGYILLKNEETIPVSLSKKELFLKAMERLSK